MLSRTLLAIFVAAAGLAIVGDATDYWSVNSVTESSSTPGA